jgi:hypothetical protein
VQQAAHFMKLEGMGLLYRGLAPPLLQKSISTGVMFGAYDHFYQALSSSGSSSSSSSSSRLLPLPPGVAHTIAALVSGALEATLAPFERVQTLLQSRAFTLTIGNSREAVALLRPLGVTEFYRGGSAVLLRNGPSTALFFGLREPLRSLLPGGGGGGGSSSSGVSDSAGTSTSGTRTGSNGLVVPAELVAPMLVPSSGIKVGVGANGSSGNSLLHMFNDFVSGAVLGA